jgi:hypothetical protein
VLLSGDISIRSISSEIHLPLVKVGLVETSVLLVVVNVDWNGWLRLLRMMYSSNAVVKILICWYGKKFRLVVASCTRDIVPRTILGGITTLTSSLLIVERDEAYLIDGDIKRTGEWVGAVGEQEGRDREDMLAWNEHINRK